MADVLGYCRYSANPVGRIVLYACGYRDAERFALSDQTCSALQLANFWQDVRVDYAKDRIYFPLEDMQRFGVDEADIAEARFTPQFRELMRHEVDSARAHVPRAASRSSAKSIASWPSTSTSSRAAASKSCAPSSARITTSSAPAPPSPKPARPPCCCAHSPTSSFARSAA